jgi:mono/diheme cytochrome c family protein
MSPDQTKSYTEPVTGGETAGRAPVPIWLMILFFLLFYWGMVYFDQHGGWFNKDVYAPYKSDAELAVYQVPKPGGIDLALGKANYEKVCGLCHQPDGLGKPGQFPPLAGSEWALGSPNRLIRIPLLGLSGAVQVHGQPWNLAMPAMGATMSDEELSATLSYIRKSFGNNASEITADQVKAIRGQLGGRAQPLSEAELLKIPEK